MAVVEVLINLPLSLNEIELAPNESSTTGHYIVGIIC